MKEKQNLVLIWIETLLKYKKGDNIMIGTLTPVTGALSTTASAY